MLLECKNLTLAYDGEPVVTNINFSASSGDYVCIVGENGTGKSTLIKGLLGIIKPIAGEVVYSGFTRADTGYLSQQVGAKADFPASVSEVIFSGFAACKGFRPGFTAKQKQTAEKFSAMLNIGDLSDASYGELSGGQRQRVLLARALCAAKKLLVLDEPVSGLDPLVAGDFYKSVDYMNKELGVCVIMSSHDINNVVKHATHMLHIKNGQLFFGTVADYMKTGLFNAFAGVAQ